MQLHKNQVHTIYCLCEIRNYGIQLLALDEV